MKTYNCNLKTGIRPTPEFAKKGLADFAVNVGLKCGHDCTYCSSGASLRCHPAFKTIGRNPFDSGYSVIDTQMPEKVAEDAKRRRKRGLIQLCTTVDAWAPEAQKLDLGRRCLEAILSESDWTVRILTKNAAVAEDFDFINKHKDRVLVGISLTGTTAKEDVLAVTEPNASPISERMAALRTAHKMGLRTYGMLCPLLPGIADDPTQIDRLVRFAASVGAEEVFAEAVNPRGNGLRRTEEALRNGGHIAEADAVARIRKRVHWSPYAAAMLGNLQVAMRKRMNTKQLRFLLYPKGLSGPDEAEIRKDDAGVVWLGG